MATQAAVNKQMLVLLQQILRELQIMNEGMGHLPNDDTEAEDDQTPLEKEGQDAKADKSQADRKVRSAARKVG